MTATTAETITPRTSAPLHPWRPLYWEPVDGTGERLMVGVLHAYNGQVGAVRILRDDVLDALYGHAADGARNLIDKSLELYRTVASASRPSSPTKPPPAISFFTEGKSASTI